MSVYLPSAFCVLVLLSTTIGRFFVHCLALAGE